MHVSPCVMNVCPTMRRVNEFNVEALLLCALPYHATNEFVRLLQTLALDRTAGWAWLARAQAGGASLPRDVLVARCANDRAVLRFLGDGAKRLGHRKGSSRTYLSFYAVAMCEMIASTQVTEPLLETLLPNIVDGLSPEASSDFRAATLMLLAELCSRTTLTETFLSGAARGRVKSEVTGLQKQRR